MTELIPSVALLAEEILDDLHQNPGAIYVEGGVGSGRGELVRRLSALSDSVCPLEFLQLTEADATSTAYLECAALLPPADRPALDRGRDTTLLDAALRVFRALHASGKVPVLRVPATWSPSSRVVLDEMGGGRRAKRILDALVQSGCPAVVVADAALSATDLGIARAHTLPTHKVGPDALEAIAWDTYRDAFVALRAAAPVAMRASPFAWRLAVGAVALGAETERVLKALQTYPVLPAVVKELAPLIPRAKLEPPVGWLLALRRPVPHAEVAVASGVAAQHLPLLTACIGYGDHSLRVAAAVRTMLAEALPARGRATPAQHDALVTHYARRDGASDPGSLEPAALQAWCEKVHHAAHGGPTSTAMWATQTLPSPELYWDRARRLSIEDRDYRGAAAVYRRCVERFPEDDYAWHYLAFNLQRAKGVRGEIDHAYRQAIELSPENPWWNSRLVTFLIEDARPSEAAQAWNEAIERVDADGTQVCDTPWLAESFHFWVADAWERAGWLHRAATVMRGIPDPVVAKALPRVGQLAQHLARHDPARGAESSVWTDFLRDMEARTGAAPLLADHARTLWRTLRERGGAELPEPMADRTSDGARLQFAWSYAHVYVEVEVDAQGGVVWFARDQKTGVYEGTEDPVPTVSEQLDAWLKRIVYA